MRKLGYGRATRVKLKLSVRDLPYLRDPVVILIDQLKEVYIDGELETIDTTNWLPKLLRKDYVVGLTGQGSGVNPRPQSQYGLQVWRGEGLYQVLDTPAPHTA